MLVQFERANFELSHFQTFFSPKRPLSANMTLALAWLRITLKAYKNMLYESSKYRFSFILMLFGPAEVHFWQKIAFTFFSKFWHFLSFLTPCPPAFTGLKTIGFHFWDYQPTSEDVLCRRKLCSSNLNVQILSYLTFKLFFRQNVRYLPTWH